MSETLLDKSVHNYNVAVMIYNSMEGDESYLNYVGYHLQQSLELAMKYILEENGVSYPKTHDIDQLIRIARENDVDLHLSDYIDDHSEMFTLWESRTRYVLNYQLELGKVEKAMDAVNDYLDRVQEAELTQENNALEEWDLDRR